jgi:tRNA A37 methylthiotransferase MiaB
MSIKENKSIYIISTGCPECYVDLKLLEKHYKDNYGYNISQSYKNADFVIVLGCAAIQGSEDYTLSLVEHMRHTMKREAEIVLHGCITKIRADLSTSDLCTSPSFEEITKILKYGDDSQGVIIPPSHRKADPVLVEFEKNFRRKHFYSLGFSQQSILRPLLELGRFGMGKCRDFVESKLLPFNAKTVCLRISMGCRNNCSYCVIRLARGKVRSKPPEAVKKAFKEFLDQGYSDFALIGTNIGDYGKDLKLDLFDLLADLVEIKGHFRIRLRNLNPQWLIRHRAGFSQLLQSGKILFINSPLQSASSRVLRLMNRGYQAEEFLECLTEIRQAYPSLIIKTHMMVGFPTESEDEYQQSLALLGRENFDHMRIFMYEDRPGTKAAGLTPKIPPHIIAQRYRKMILKLFFSQPLRKVRAIYRLNYQK